ncbi:MAG: redoxin domain-containing protein [Rhizobacter sp.]|nr:redoxin domain-containing protein [Bacteriovorax sp.]
MICIKFLIILLVFYSYSSVVLPHESESETAPVIETYAEDFRLIDQNDNSHAMSYYSDFKSIMLVGYNIECQSALEKTDLLKQLQSLSQKYGVKIFFIDPDIKNERQKVKAAMKDSKFSYPVLMDEIQMISHSYNIQNAGDFVLIDTVTLVPYLKGTLFKKQCSEVLSDTLAKGFSNNKNIDCHDKSSWQKIQRYLNFSYVPGRCNLGYIPTKNINYTQHVAPVISKTCMRCHNSDDFGSFQGYQKVAGWSAMIRQVIRDQRMPPSGLDAYYHGFTSDYKLHDLRYLIEWAESKKLRGEGPDPLENFEKKDSKFAAFYSKNKTPDLVIEQKKIHRIPATGILEYQEADLGGPTKEDLWIKAVQIKINQRVVHHANLLVLDHPVNEAKVKTKFDGMRKISKTDVLFDKIKDSNGVAILVKENIALTSKKIDNTSIVMPAGIAMHIPKGKYLAMEYHYNTTGKIEENKAQIELFLYKKHLKLKEQKVMCIHRNGFNIQPGAKNFTVTSRLKLPGAITILSLKPHFHYRGKSVKYIIEGPDGKREVLLSVPFYQFKYQQHYFLRTPKVVQNGSYIITEVVYDNSKEFFQNPDQSIDVPLGSQTYTDEMHLPRIFYVDGEYTGKAKY